MQNQLLLLEKIQEIDIQISVIEEDARQYQGDMERLEADAQEINGRMEVFQSELNELDAVRKSLEEEVVACAERIRKNEDRLKNIKNEKEFNAATKEMNAAKKEKLARENEIGKLHVTIEEKKGELKKEEDRFNQSKGALEEKQQNLPTRKEGWEKGIKEKRDEREAIAKDITPSLLKRYDTIREKRQGVAIVSVVNGTCQGCYMNIPPQAYIQLQKGSQELIFCPHCHRILYWRQQAASSAAGK